MKQVVHEILEGNFKFDSGSLDFSCPRIELSVLPDQIVEGSFTVYGPEGVVTEGKVVSSDLRMKCLTPAFGGSQDEIFYQADTSEMKAGDEIKGAFHIISNQGEYYIPFSVNVIHKTIESSLGTIKNLFHFTNLAKSNWAEAVDLFYSGELGQIFTGNDRQFYAAYKGLSTIYGNEHNVEEFLLFINKKKSVEFIPEDTQIKIEDPIALSRYALVINRNGWGYTYLRIETEGDFLKVNEEVVSEDAFLGNIYRLYYYILDEKLHAGNNFGCIRLISFEKTIEIPVTVICKSERDRRYAGIRKEKKHVTLQLMQYYQAFRLKKISTKTWMEESGKLIERLKELDGKDLSARLFQSQLLMSQERFNEAKWILKQEEERIEDLREGMPELWCYYLYLTTLYSNDDEYTDAVSQRISTLYWQNRGNWRIAWLLLFVSDEYTKNPSGKWAFLEELFTYHCYSPIIYMEAWNLICMNPAMLLKLGEFELQVLHYAAKNEAMKDDVLIQLLYLAQKQKTYSESLFRILTACYGKKMQDDILQAICATLIKGNKYGPKYFKWYRLGVEQNLRITRLYEYYMMSHPLDDKEALPKMILMYFSYQSDLNYETTAYLYAYVHKHQEELEDIYVNFIPAIEHFVIEQIKRGRINKDLAYLYRNFVVQSMVDEELAKALMPLLFMKEITVESDIIKQVIPVYPYTDVQEAYPVTGKSVQVPIYDENCKLILEDDSHNRYVCSVSCQTKPLVTTGKLSLLAAPFAMQDIGYALYVCYDRKSSVLIQEDNVERFRFLADSDYLVKTRRQEIRIKLIQFYYEKNRMWELDEYLQALAPEDVAAADRKEIVHIMVLRGMYPEAYAWVRRLGPYGIDAKTLLKLCSRMLEQGDMEEDPFVTGILHHVLNKGKYDEQVLTYLVRNFNGSTKDMRDIWKSADSFGVDTYDLCERIIVQLIYTGAYIGEKMDIFRAYMQSGGKEEVITAFLSQCCYDYVIREKIVEPILFKSILQLYKEKADLHLVCKLAYLKYYAENPSEITEDIQAVIRDFLQELLNRQIVLPLFKEFHNFLPALDILQDKSVLEYRARPGNRVTIHYQILKDDDSAEKEYCREYMRDIFAGICVKEFILFFGERMLYYITETVDGEEKVMQSGTISKSDVSDTTHESSRFSMINDIMIGRTLRDYDTVDTLLEEYYKKDFMIEKVFRPQ